MVKTKTPIIRLNFNSNMPAHRRVLAYLDNQIPIPSDKTQRAQRRTQGEYVIMLLDELIMSSDKGEMSSRLADIHPISDVSFDTGIEHKTSSKFANLDLEKPQPDKSKVHHAMTSLSEKDVPSPFVEDIDELDPSSLFGGVFDENVNNG